MILEYNYWFFKQAIPGYICDQIIEMGLTSMYDNEQKYGKDVSNATTGDWKQKTSNTQVAINADSISNLQKKGVNIDNAYVRDSNVTFLGNPELYELIWPFIHKANAQAKWNFDWDYTEDFQFTKYSPGQFYGWHADTSGFPYTKFNPDTDPLRKHADGTPAIDMFGGVIPEAMDATTNDNLVGKIRKLSVTLSLNNPSEYSGGNLRFDMGPHKTTRYHTCKEIRPQGSLIVFPSHIQHQVTPVTRGTRYSLVCWNLGKPFR